MRKGKYAANEATLRMKMDMLSPNPNMWDQVIIVMSLCCCLFGVEAVSSGPPIHIDHSS